ncbi:MAG: caspase family protein [Dokdonella sp.]
MPSPIQQISLAQLAFLLGQHADQAGARPISEVHLHHTYRPDHSSWRGLASVEAMRLYHMRDRGFIDIAQHLTIDPNGALWSGRSFNLRPASEKGQNGGQRNGEDYEPFMIEMVGNFGSGKIHEIRDTLRGKQLDAVVAVLSLLIEAIKTKYHKTKYRSGTNVSWFDLVRAHHQLGAAKTCPGDSVWQQPAAKKPANDEGWRESPIKGPMDAVPADSATWSGELLQARSILASADAPTPEYAGARGADSLAALLELPRQGVNGDGAEASAPEGLIDDGLIENYARIAQRAQRGLRGADVPSAPAPLALRHHVVNLRNGYLSDDGDFQTSPDDLRAMLQVSLRDYLQQRAAAKLDAHLMLWAHGGLVDDDSAINYARSAIPFWRANGIYPIFFIWKTGLLESLFQIISPRDMRGVATDLSDRFLETTLNAAVRPLWTQMKRSAERAAQPILDASGAGGGWLFAQMLCAALNVYTEEDGQLNKTLFPNENSLRLNLHVCGHSAGAIFMNHWLRAWRANCQPNSDADNPEQSKPQGRHRVQTLSLLAPAIRLDTFKQQSLPFVARDASGKAWIDRLDLYSMDDEREQDDDCMKAYRKSLLYFVSNACENDRKTPILGMSRFLEEDGALVNLLLNARGQRPWPPGQTASGSADVKPGTSIAYWSAEANDHLNLTKSTSHGGFDNDAATLNRIARAMVGNAPVFGAEKFIAAERGFDAEDRHAARNRGYTEAARAAIVRSARPATESMPTFAPARQTGGGSRPTRLRALCVGIDEYSTLPLSGCVADARQWHECLGNAGFDTTLMLDASASLDRVKRALDALIVQARAGDALVFQFSGHGTQFADENGDEDDGFDEAFVLVDYQDGGYLLDDDFAEIAAGLPAHTSLTLFMDCCHSGTNSRMAPPLRARGGNTRVRFMPASAQMQGAYRARRAATRAAPVVARPDAQRRIVHFGACQDHEYAYETEGHGAFTQAAVPLLAIAQNRSLDPIAFARLIQGAIAAPGPQHPQILIDTDSPALAGALFQVF